MSDKLAILDIGTRATRLLLGTTNALEGEFDFNHFYSRGRLTHLGQAMREDGTLDIDDLERTVDALNKYARRCRKEGVVKVIAVGTAALREAKNRDEVIDYIHRCTGLILRPITKDEEGQMGTLAALVSMTDLYYQSGESFLLIDQGGGSTEVSYGRYDGGKDYVCQHVASLDLGTQELEKLLYNGDDPDDGQDGLSRVRAKIAAEVEVLREHPLASTPSGIVGLGAAITVATGRRGAKHQHGTLLRSADLARLMSPQTELTQEQEEHHNLLRCGLPGYQAILDVYELDDLRVCGAALRYGVFASEVLGLHEWPDALVD